MGKALPDNTIDGSLNYVKNNVTAICVCSTQPTTRTEALTTYMLATTSFAGTDITIANGDTSGRKATMAAKNGVSVTNSGDAQHIALISGTELLLVTTCTTQTLTSGNTVNIPSFKWEIADPT
jgi:hypothetical protein